MSGGHFHVHGPHDHAVEHAGQDGDPFSSKLAVITAVLATVGAMFSYMGGATQNDAMLFKNSAAIKKTEASNQWNFYQAKSNKQNLAELAAALNDGDKKEKYLQEVERYKGEKTDIKKKAEELEAQSHDQERLSDESMHQHHRWAQAMTAVQIAISLAAITLLTRKRWLTGLVLGSTAVGVVLAALAVMHI